MVNCSGYLIPTEREQYLLYSEKFCGESVGGIADCVKLVKGEQQLGEPGVDPAAKTFSSRSS